MLRFVSAVLMFLCLGAVAARAASAERGFDFARMFCSRCHAVDELSASPLAAAPPFRTLHLQRPPKSLNDLLAEGILTGRLSGHPTMPQFQLNQTNVDDLMEYFRTLEQ